MMLPDSSSDARDALDDQVAIVTGGSRGIGLAVAHQLVDCGATVVISSRKQADLDAAAAELNSGHARGAAVGWAAHSGRPEELSTLVDRTIREFGRIDLLVNNSATNIHFGPLLGAELSAWDKMFEVNVRGPFALTRLVVEQSMGKRGGAIVNVASIGGVVTVADLGLYNITKAALIHMTRQLAMELGPRGIRVNAVAPALVRTRFVASVIEDEARMNALKPFNPLGRIAEPEEVADAITYLLSERASYVNGHVLIMDGGAGRPG
jgi:NAD(P)-dependent dehydrogenase (short-subunit alcohol dehydrogenase family)